MLTTKAARVLRRLPAWSAALAAARLCVLGKASWPAPDIGRRLLTTNKVHGLFINYIDHDRPHLFARPTSNSMIDAMLDFLPDDNDRRSDWSVLDHSNGLLLCDLGTDELCVCNPATRRWTIVPWPRRRQAPVAVDPAVMPGKPSNRANGKTSDEKPRSVDEDNYTCPLMELEIPRAPEALIRFLCRPSGQIRLDVCAGMYLAFDPAVSPHYEVLAIPAVPEKPAKRTKGRKNSNWRRLMESEWPPTPWTLNIFSSRSGQWEERDFVREGEPAGTVRDMLVDPAEPSGMGPQQRYAVYYQGALYVHCRGFFVLRLSLSNGTYQVIKTPAYGKTERFGKPYLGRSEKGVYFGIVEESELRVWILSESSRHGMDWILKHQNDLTRYGQHMVKYGRQMDAPWMVHDVPDTDDEDADVAAKTLQSKTFDWDSDNDDFFTVEFDANEYSGYFDIIGFHPYKEVLYLTNTFEMAAYHLNNSKVQYLGDSRPKSYYHNHTNGIYEGFVYSPCMVGEVNEENIGQSSP